MNQQNQIPSKVAIIELSLLALSIALFLWWAYPRPQLPDTSYVAIGTTTRAIVAFHEPHIEARAAYVYDTITGKVLYERDANLEWPLASLTKLMTALVASKTVPDYMLVRITGDDIREEGDSGLLVDESWNIKNLIDFSLITSSNDGVRAIASVAGSQISSTSTAPVATFVETMNETARDLGLSKTRFNNQSGLDVSSIVSGGYSSARDVAMLVDHILKTNPHLLEATSYIRTDIASQDKDHVAQNTDVSIADIPDVIASKTGYTDLSGGNVVVAFNAGLHHPIIISVMGSSYDGRFTDLEALASSTLSYIRNKAQ